MLDLSDAEWTEWQRDPVDYYEVYDGGPVFLDDLRMPMLRIPVADYTAAHLLAAADAYGMCRISFDGWRYVSFPMPGDYPGEGYGWPANNQWKSEKDRTVRYPLTFTTLIVELPEKTLHLKEFVPAPRPEIYLKDLVVCEGPIRTLDDPQ